METQTNGTIATTPQIPAGMAWATNVKTLDEDGRVVTTTEPASTTLDTAETTNTKTRKPTVTTPLAKRLWAAREFIAGRKTKDELATQFGVTRQSVTIWVAAEKTRRAEQAATARAGKTKVVKHETPKPAPTAKIETKLAEQLANAKTLLVQIGKDHADLKEEIETLRYELVVRDSAIAELFIENRAIRDELVRVAKTEK